jgi:hypothetical protein
MTRSESNRGLRTTRQYKHSWTVKPSVLYRDSASANSIALQHLSMSIVRRGHLKYSRSFQKRPDHPVQRGNPASRVISRVSRHATIATLLRVSEAHPPEV